MAGANAWLERARAVPAAAWATLAVLATATVALAMPLATVQWLPFVDYPEHASAIAAIHGQGDPIFDRYFVVEYARTAYLLFYVAGDWLAYLFGAEGAGRAMTILSVATLPLAIALYLRVHERPAIGGAIAAPVAYNAWLFWGFLPYSLGMVVGVVALAAAARVARRPDARTALALAIAATLTFYAHAQLYAWMGLACVVQLAAMAPALGRARALRATGWSALAAIPSIAAAIAWLRASDVLEHGEAGARSGHAAEVAAAGGAPSFTPVADTVRGWLSHSFDVYRDGTGVEIAAAFFVVVLVWIALRRGSGPSAPEAIPAPPPDGSRLARLWQRAADPGMPATIAPELVLVATFALYLFAPFSYRLIEPINHRFLPLALALLPVLGPRGTSLRMPALVTTAALATALAIGSAQAHASRFAETDREMGDLAIALSETRPGMRLLGLIHDAQSEIVPLPLYLHAHQHYQARVGGLACWGFVELPKSPVQYAAGAAPPPFPPRFEWTPHAYDHARWGASFDYWLVRHGLGRRPPNPFRAGSSPAPVAIYEGDRWTLYGRESPPDRDAR